MKHPVTILLFNNSTHLPFPLSSILYSDGWVISFDKELIDEVAVVVFHLPSLVNDSSLSHLEKKNGQLWIGWRLAGEPDIRQEVTSVWECVFDLYLTYSPECYWECATRHGRNMYTTAKTFNLLDYVIKLQRKVDFMLIGTQKGGSTALHEYLNQHPSCWGSYYKEPGFFLYPCIQEKGLYWYITQMWKERAPYRYSFSHNLLFESSTWYSYWHEIPERLCDYNPNLKFIFLVRNPIERAHSQYNMLTQWNKKKLIYEYNLYPDKQKLSTLIDQLLDVRNYPFSYWVDMEISKISNNTSTPTDFFPDFLHRGFYYEQLERYYQYFPKENILVVESGELKTNRIHTLKQIESFLGIQPTNWDNINLDEKFTSRYDTTMSEQLRKKLSTFFKTYNEKLYRLIDKNYNWK